mmetsp:Transcript_23630/g.59924  ORF Transcript_23630/g.59924 Transcript_23630/m.59924 type:complete len:247 (+) Transcript_23630:2428-3168(+)
MRRGRTTNTYRRVPSTRRPSWAREWTRSTEWSRRWSTSRWRTARRLTLRWSCCRRNSAGSSSRSPTCRARACRAGVSRTASHRTASCGASCTGLRAARATRTTWGSARRCPSGACRGRSTGLPTSRLSSRTRRWWRSQSGQTRPTQQRSIMTIAVPSSSSSFAAPSVGRSTPAGAPAPRGAGCSASGGPTTQPTPLCCAASRAGRTRRSTTRRACPAACSSRWSRSCAQTRGSGPSPAEWWTTGSW